jgi:hypothetical protein
MLWFREEIVIEGVSSTILEDEIDLSWSLDCLD